MQTFEKMSGQNMRFVLIVFKPALVLVIQNFFHEHILCVTLLYF